MTHGDVQHPSSVIRPVNTQVLTKSGDNHRFATMPAKSTWLQIRVTPAEKSSIRAAAEAAGMDLSAYVLAKSLPSKPPEFDSLIAWMLASPDSHVPFAECVDYLQTLPAARGVELARKPQRFDELPLHRQNLVCAWVEHRAALWGVRSPAWVLGVPALDRPYFGTELINLRPWLFLVSPTVYRRRNIFVERGLGWRLAPISPPALPDEAEALERAFAPSAAAEPPPRRRVAEDSPRYGDPSTLSRDQIIRLIGDLDGELARAGVKAELLMVGGAVMTIVFQAREQTKDVDAVFEPEQPVRDAVRRIAEREGLPEDWLNDAARGFLAPAGQFDPYFDGEGLRVFVASAEYVLAMKILAMRPEGVAPDQADIRFLCRYLGITNASAAMDIVEKYYPERRLTPRIRFGLEELLQADE